MSDKVSDWEATAIGSRMISHPGLSLRCPGSIALSRSIAYCERSTSAEQARLRIVEGNRGHALDIGIRSHASLPLAMAA